MSRNTAIEAAHLIERLDRLARSGEALGEVLPDFGVELGDAENDTFGLHGVTL